MEFKHISVLLSESVESLGIKPDGIYVDGTMGGGGHSEAIVTKLSPVGRLIGIDRDTEALRAAKKRLENFQNVTYAHNNYKISKMFLTKTA